MLIIGRGDTASGAGKIERVNTATDALQRYGDSELYRACRSALDLGAPYVYAANTPVPSDVVDVINVLKSYDFTYIVPVSIFISEYFHNRKVEGKKTYYMEYFARKLSGSGATLIATDKHASLYEDIDHFLDYMIAVKDSVRKRLMSDSSIFLNSICFVANNLERHDFANAVLAAVLCAAPMDEYPSADFGPAVFDIDFLDLGHNEMAYFKNNYLTGTTVENLVNFERVGKTTRNVMADRIAKYISKELDLSRFKGRLATNYQRARAEQEVIDFLESERNRTLEGYDLDPVRLFKDAPGSSTLHVEFDIYPINFKDRVAIKVEN